MRFAPRQAFKCLGRLWGLGRLRRFLESKCLAARRLCRSFRDMLRSLRYPGVSFLSALAYPAPPTKAAVSSRWFRAVDCHEVTGVDTARVAAPLDKLLPERDLSPGQALPRPLTVAADSVAVSVPYPSPARAGDGVGPLNSSMPTAFGIDQDCCIELQAARAAREAARHLLAGYVGVSLWRRETDVEALCLTGVQAYALSSLCLKVFHRVPRNCGKQRGRSGSSSPDRPQHLPATDRNAPLDGYSQHWAGRLARGWLIASQLAAHPRFGRIKAALAHATKRSRSARTRQLSI